MENQKQNYQQDTTKLEYNTLLTVGISIKCRYSETNDYDKQGRWMRTFHYKNLFIGKISKVRHEGIDIYTLHPYFPCGNCFTSVHPILMSKNEGQTLINEFAKLWNGFITIF
jgi:hypothetical protein